MIEEIIKEAESTWSSLDTVKIIISVITPLIGALIALRLSKIGKDLEKKQRTGRKVVEKRLHFYDRVIPLLNDLYCYNLRVGNWKELFPYEVIKTKRTLDKEFHIYSHLFKVEIMSKYDAFIGKCFKTHTGIGEDAKLKITLDERTGLESWNSEWNKLFVPNEQVSLEEFKNPIKNSSRLSKEILK